MKLQALIIFGLITVSLYSQEYDRRECKVDSNKNLKAYIENGKIPSLNLGMAKAFRNAKDADGYEIGFTGDWSTSILAPNVTLPKLPKEQNFDNEKLFVKYDNLTCKYSPYYAMDGDPSTAWSEGVDGDGIGEVLLTFVDVRKKIKIWTGYGRSEEIFKNNNRPKDVTLYIFEALNTSDGTISITLQNLVLRGQVEYTLKDENGYQEISLPKVKLIGSKGTVGNSGDRFTVLGIKINSVYKGEKYQDTLISEVSN
ncbi:hypothetical protein QMN07_16715 [Leptospira santarosai]|uniref:NADase-type glycan-binding domain-containing protein n=1 Tax=Leptospira santarosai TaxID=28183 RepID=UPI0024AFB6E3|nr:hypothetical protein [Leptospira santarosai]MDI7219141.1 hypothetical protein [Leptospira santarosai]